MAAHYLIADARERAVTPFLEEALARIKLPLASRLIAGRQVNTGDYLICHRTSATDATPRIRACIERKTLLDFAASFKDGRHANIQKMRDLRTQTGCQLYYIIEGPAFPSRARRFGRIPYGSILTAITHLMVRDNVMIIQTESEAHSAARLADLLDAFDRVRETFVGDAPIVLEVSAPATSVGGAPATSVGGAPANSVGEAPANSVGGAPNSATESGTDAPDGGVPTVSEATEAEPTIPDCLTTPIRQTDNEATVSMWMQLRGVSAVLGKIISEKFSVADLARGRVSDQQLKQLQTATGRAINAAALASLRAIAKGGGAGPVVSTTAGRSARTDAVNPAARIISGVRGFSTATAQLILNAIGGLVKLSDAANSAECAEIKLPHGSKLVRLGVVRANRLQSLLNHIAS